MLLLLADAAVGVRRTDEALRLTSRVAESVGAQKTQKGAPAWARALYAVRMARLVDGARRKGRSGTCSGSSSSWTNDGISSYAGQMLVAVTWSHPDAKLQLRYPPGKGVFQGASVSGGEVGIEAQRYPQTQPGGGRFA